MLSSGVLYININTMNYGMNMFFYNLFSLSTLHMLNLLGALATSTQRYYTGGSKPLFTGGLANRLCLVACGNNFFHRRVTENRPACGKAFLQAVQLCQPPVEIFW